MGRSFGRRVGEGKANGKMCRAARHDAVERVTRGLFGTVPKMSDMTLNDTLKDRAVRANVCGSLAKFLTEDLFGPRGK